MTIIYGSSSPGDPELLSTPAMVRTYNSGQYNALASTTLAQHSFKPSGSQVTALIAATSSGDAVCQTVINYFAPMRDLQVGSTGLGQPICVYHEFNPDLSPSDAKAMHAKVLSLCMPSINSGRTFPLQHGPIFAANSSGGSSTSPAGRPLFGTGYSRSAVDQWVAAGSAYIGCDIYITLSNLTNGHDYAVVYKGLPWNIPELGTSVANDPPDTGTSPVSHLKHMQDVVTQNNGYGAGAASPILWFNQNHNLLNTTLSAAVSPGATTFTVDAIPGKSDVGVWEILSGYQLLVDPYGTNPELVTLNATTTSGSGSGPYTLHVAASQFAHSHANNAVVFLMPQSVAYWTGPPPSPAGPSLANPIFTSASTSSGTGTCAIVLPSPIGFGDAIVLVEMEQTQTPTISWPAGFNDVTPAGGNRANLSINVSKKTAAGTEGGTTVNVGTNGIAPQTVIAIVWPGAHIDQLLAAIDSATQASFTSPDTPVGGNHYGVISVGGIQHTVTVTWSPAAGYIQGDADGQAVAAAVQMGAFYDADTGTISTTGTITNGFTGGSNSHWAALTLVFAPGTGGYSLSVIAGPTTTPVISKAAIGAKLKALEPLGRSVRNAIVPSTLKAAVSGTARRLSTTGVVSRASSSLIAKRSATAIGVVSAVVENPVESVRTAVSARLTATEAPGRNLSNVITSALVVKAIETTIPRLAEAIAATRTIVENPVETARAAVTGRLAVVENPTEILRAAVAARRTAIETTIARVTASSTAFLTTSTAIETTIARIRAAVTASLPIVENPVESVRAAVAARVSVSLAGGGNARQTITQFHTKLVAVTVSPRLAAVVGAVRSTATTTIGRIKATAVGARLAVVEQPVLRTAAAIAAKIRATGTIVGRAGAGIAQRLFHAATTVFGSVTSAPGTGNQIPDDYVATVGEPAWEISVDDGPAWTIRA